MNLPFSLLRVALTGAAALLLAGGQTVVFGLANRGIGRPDASVVYDAVGTLSLDIYRPPTPGPTHRWWCSSTAAAGSTAAARSTVSSVEG